MTRKTICISGVTGFLGSHIARTLVNAKYEVIALKRETSDLIRCSSFLNNVLWISLDDSNWVEQVKNSLPDIFIHAAWSGVNAQNRNSWQNQISNIEFTKQLLDVCVELNASRFIGFGSQAEYGYFSGKISEDAPIQPTSAYGVIKHTCAEMIKLICTENKIDWYWLRLFSFFGEGESKNWLIPSVIDSILTKNSMDFTLGEQKYAYLYVEDLAKAILQVVEAQAKSGIYNISSANPLSLKEIITGIRDYINPSFQLNFGVLPYRSQQSMLMEGDCTKFEKYIGKIDSSHFWEKLFRTIDYYNKL